MLTGTIGFFALIADPLVFKEGATKEGPCVLEVLSKFDGGDCDRAGCPVFSFTELLRKFACSVDPTPGTRFAPADSNEEVD